MCVCSSLQSRPTPRTVVARQASLSMEFSRQEYWSGLPFPSPGNLPRSEASQVWSPGLKLWRRILYLLSHSVQFSSVWSLSRVQLFVTPWITARQASLSITNSQSLPKLMSIESVMPSSLLILWATRGSLKIYTMGQCRRLGTEALYAWFAFCWLDLMTFQEDWLWKNSFVITDITALFLLQLWNSGLHGIGYQFLICS